MSAESQSPRYISLIKGNDEVRRWTLPAESEWRSPRREEPASLLFNFQPSRPLGRQSLLRAKADLLLAPHVRAARDDAYAAAIVRHSPTVASAAASCAKAAVINGQPRETALIKAAAHATALSAGLHALIASCVGERAGALLEAGYNRLGYPGAALAGAKAYGAAMWMAHPQAAAEAASVAAANACEAAAMRDDPRLATLQSRGSVTSDVADEARVAGVAAAEAVVRGASFDDAITAGRAAAQAMHQGLEERAALCAGATATSVSMSGRGQGAAMAAAISAGQSLRAGHAWDDSMGAGIAAGEAIEGGMSFEEAMLAGNRAAEGTDKYAVPLSASKHLSLSLAPSLSLAISSLRPSQPPTCLQFLLHRRYRLELLDGGEQPIRSWHIGIDDSRAIACGTTGNSAARMETQRTKARSMEARVQQYLDGRLKREELTALLKRRADVTTEKQGTCKQGTLPPPSPAAVEANTDPSTSDAAAAKAATPAAASAAPSPGAEHEASAAAEAPEATADSPAADPIIMLEDAADVLVDAVAIEVAKPGQPEPESRGAGCLLM